MGQTIPGRDLSPTGACPLLTHRMTSSINPNHQRMKRLGQLKKSVGLGLLIWIGSTAIASAQNDILKSLQTNSYGQGKVTIHQDPRIAELVGSPQGNAVVSTSPDGKQRVLKTSGYRVQVYAGNNTRNAKMQAQEKADKVRELFPELTVYATFAPPRWLCRVGDFRSMEEADATMRKLRASGEFKEASIVRDQISIAF